MDIAATTVVTTTKDLAALCARLAKAEYITVDTEFIRERTFWPQLCLVQVAGPDVAVAIDAMVEDIDLTPLYELMAEKSVLKVFHAARQDIEILFNLSGRGPEPMFDTQIAAMVCGFGDSVSYEALVTKLAKAHIDKSLRFTDWARRPLTDRQLRYAIDDVRHLRTVYEKLAKRLDKSGRTAWVAEEMAALTDPAAYTMHPDVAWRRIKTRVTDPRALAILREVAAWRESEAQTRDVPRNRIVRDEALLEIATHAPASAKDLARTRGLARSIAEGAMGRKILAAVTRGAALPDADCPQVPKRRPTPRGIGPVADLLKVLLKMKSEKHDVAQRLIANSADIERIAAENEPDVPALHGWRRDVFGNDALALKKGRLALMIRDRRLHAAPLPEEPKEKRDTKEQHDD